MGPVAQSVKLSLGAAQCGFVRECLEQLAMTGPGLMNSRKNRIDDAESASRAEALRRQSIAGMHMAVLARSVFQGAYDRRADRDNSAATRPRALDGGGG